ncbi:MAG: tetratricopeptide repeat protein [Polyangiales bacterium]
MRNRAFLRLLAWVVSFAFVTGPAVAQPAPSGPSPTGAGSASTTPSTAPGTPASDSGAAGTTSTPASGATPSEPGASAGPDPTTAAPSDRDTPRDVASTGLPSFLVAPPAPIVDTRPPPSAEQVAALLEMEAEVGRLTDAGQAYQAAVVSLLRREHNRQRRGRTQWYTDQIGREERALDEARLRAIEEFERFVRRYPDDPTYTPDAMFRLGELYYERSQSEFQRAADAAQAGAPPPEGNSAAPPDTPDYTQTIELYQQLVRRFPEYRRLDGVLYLIGYCLNEMGRTDEAREAWLALVCHDHFEYRPLLPGEAPPPAPEPTPTPAEVAASQHPSLTLDSRRRANAEPPAPPAWVDPYVDCHPVSGEARFVSETWFRIGESHFDDYGAPNAVKLAISAYSRILVDPTDRNYSLALYKIAWAYYRNSDYPQAIRYFSQVVQWSDDERARTGRAGSDLRPEAIQYLGISFEYDDWNENQVPDVQESMPSGFQRIQDSSLLPQDRAWTPEVYFQLGQTFYDDAKYPEAIEVWEYAVRRWPSHERVPEIVNQIALANRQHNQREQEFEALDLLSRFGPDSDWYRNNMDNPAAQRAAEMMAEGALIRVALDHHETAQRLRRQCVEEQNLALCQQASQEYTAAAQGYRLYLTRYPNNPQAYELQYNLADALFWSEQYEEAAVAYAAVRDSNLDNSHMSEAARRVVESLKRLVDQAAAQGRISIRTEPPAPSGTPPTVTPVQMPELVQRLAQAREFYLARVDEAHDSEHVRAAYDFNNALLLYFYGYWPQAKERLTRIFEQRCAGPLADQTGRIAWENLRAMAIATDDNEAIGALAREIQERQCTFSATGQAHQVDAQFCAQEANRNDPQCLSLGDINALQYREALDVFRRAEGEAQDRQRPLYEQAATMLLNAVNQNPGDPQAPIALEYAATALERTQRFSSAGDLYQRIIDEVGPRRGSTPDEQASLDRIVSNAYFRLAFNAERFFDFDRAVQSYQVLADSPRFASSQDPSIRDRRVDALVNTAVIMQNLQRYPQATQYYRRVADTVQDADTKRGAIFSIAMIAFRSRDYNGAIRAFRDFIQRYQSESAAGELVVEAQWHIAECYLAQNKQNDYRTALTETVNLYQRSGQPAGSMAAEYAAHARFLLVDSGLAPFESFAINPGRPATMQAYVQGLVASIDAGANQATTLKNSYDPIPDYRRPTWTIAAFVRQGRIYEILARAVLNTPFVMPGDMQRQLRSLDEVDREDIRTQVEDQVRQVLDSRARPIECLAVVRYSLAARAARAGSLDDEYTRTAIDRLQTYGDERIAECIAQAQAQDATFQAYQPGEFSRAPHGQDQNVTPGVGAPSLATESER